MRLTLPVKLMVCLGLFATPVFADTMKLELTLNRTAKEIRIGKDFGDVLIAENAGPGSTHVNVEVFDDSPTRALLTTWTNGELTAFPLLLSTAFSNLEIGMHVNLRDAGMIITKRTVFANCVSGYPASVTQAFQMFYWCKAAALELEKDDRLWSIPHRSALQGWAVANYYLFSRGNVSPYGIDQDLVSRLDKVADEQATIKEKKAYWSPLRLEDVALLPLSFKTSEVRLVGQTPFLLTKGKLAEALRINERAAAILADNNVNSAFGVDKNLINGNVAYIKGMIAKTSPTP